MTGNSCHHPEVVENECLSCGVCLRRPHPVVVAHTSDLRRNDCTEPAFLGPRQVMALPRLDEKGDRTIAQWHPVISKPGYDPCGVGFIAEQAIKAPGRVFDRP